MKYQTKNNNTTRKNTDVTKYKFRTHTKQKKMSKHCKAEQKKDRESQTTAKKTNKGGKEIAS